MLWKIPIFHQFVYVQCIYVCIKDCDQIFCLPHCCHRYEGGDFSGGEEPFDDIDELQVHFLA